MPGDNVLGEQKNEFLHPEPVQTKCTKNLDTNQIRNNQKLIVGKQKTLIYICEFIRVFNHLICRLHHYIFGYTITCVSIVGLDFLDLTAKQSRNAHKN